MKFTLSWLKNFIETEATVTQISEALTSIGLEVEGVEDKSEILKPFTVAEILEAAPHPNADKLRVCKVNNGVEILQIVCGAANARSGIKIPLASVGVVIPTNGLVIKKSKIRDVESNGMLCSAEELGLVDASEGILELPQNAIVGEPFAKFTGSDDAVFEIAITPNRGDCLGVYGVARDLAAYGLGVLKSQNFEDFAASFKSPINVKIEADAKDACKYFVGVYIKDVNNKQAPDWMVRQLQAVGQKSISALVDITNYLNLTFGRPAHVYDADKISGNITIRFAKSGEKILALNDKEYELNPNILVITDEKAAPENQPIAIAGVIGGKNTGATAATKNAFFEIAWFEPISVAKSGRSLQIDSDARYRFERNVDTQTFAHYKTAVNFALDFCGGQASEPVFAGDTNYTAPQIKISTKLFAKKIGYELAPAKQVELLNKLGFNAMVQGETIDSEIISANVPSFRPDIAIDMDIIEEIARINGYNNIPATRLYAPENSQKSLNAAQKALANSRRLIAAKGFDEVVSFSFMEAAKAKLFTNADLINLANPISAELGVMRPSIIPNLLDAVQKNERQGKNNQALFEVGFVFAKENNNIVQKQTITGVLSGKTSDKNIYGDSRSVDAFDAKAAAFDAVSAYITPESLKIKSANLAGDGLPAYYHPSKAASLVLGNKVIGYFGELHPTIIKKFALKILDSKGCISAFEIFVDEAPQPKDKKQSSKGKFEPSNLQAVKRDFAFILDANIAAEEIILAVKKAQKTLLENISIFDVYEDQNNVNSKVGAGKKSVAFSITLQPTEKTLTDDEITKICDNVISAVISATGAILRAA
jgi:phenylalanyl-tRNA synthetase beta chain